MNRIGAVGHLRSPPISIITDDGGDDDIYADDDDIYAFRPFAAKLLPPPKTLGLPEHLFRRPAARPTLSPVPGTPLSSPVPCTAATPPHSPMQFDLQHTPEQPTASAIKILPSVEQTPLLMSMMMTERLTAEAEAEAAQKRMVPATPGAGEQQRCCPLQRSDSGGSSPHAALAWQVLPATTPRVWAATAVPAGALPTRAPAVRRRPPVQLDRLLPPPRPPVAKEGGATQLSASIPVATSSPLARTAVIPSSQSACDLRITASPWACFLHGVHALLGCQERE